MKTRLVTLLFIAALAGLMITCSSLDNDTLAVVEGELIPLESFTAEYSVQRFADKDRDYIADKVDDFVRKHVFALEAREMGMANTEDVKTKMKLAERRFLLQYVYDRAILDAVMHDEFLREHYETAKEEIHARHVLLGYEGLPRATASRDRQEALALTGQIKSRLDAGEKFEDLANEFTDDPSGKNNGGDLGWFGWGQMVDAFQKTAFALDVGQISDVVETQFGFHIIKLEGRRDRGLGTFEEAKETLKRDLRRAKTEELRDAANLFLEERKNIGAFSFNNTNMDEFLRIWKDSPNKNGPIDEVLTKLKYSKPLFRLEGGNHGSEWLIEEVGDMDPSQRPAFKNENQLRSIIENIVTQYLILQYGREEGYVTETAFQERMRELEDKYVYDAYMKSEVNDKLDPTEDDLKGYYEKHKEEKYMDEEKVQVREIFVKDQALAEDLRKRIDAGENFDQLAGRYTERKSTKDKRGELPAFQRGRYGEMGKAAFNLEIGEIAGPLPLGNGYSIIKLEKKVEAGPKSFEKVRGRIRTAINSDLREARVAELMGELKKKFGVKINYPAAYSFYEKAGDESA